MLRLESLNVTLVLEPCGGYFEPRPCPAYLFSLVEPLHELAKGLKNDFGQITLIGGGMFHPRRRVLAMLLIERTDPNQPFRDFFS